MGSPQGTVYLLHFDRPYEHARHYTGWTTDLDSRLAEHATGRGARLLEVVSAAGIGWELARTWPGTRARERQLKRQGGASRHCPMCGVKPRNGGLSVQVQAVNRQAQRKYAEFIGALDFVREVLTEAGKLVKKHNGKPGDAAWSIPDRDELEAAHKKAVDDLQALRSSAKKYEKELVSRTWRV
ncbi:hypothetical protein [Gandjariella thermophila]|uniref:GIY-YIG domain-containing protein n=1 Tax=Gandjariella thermophila TaxID=1931992 RepID=A0A4D4J1V8_9PSEU|nr:hypothetical protein [Gandjariella thermophila]GDY28768.1 hypothetical protein GTS_04010 [Gandjariella thermophila]